MTLRRTFRDSWLELVRALCVLGLIFLNFGHVAVATPVVGDVLTLSADASFCGDPMDGAQAHAPCHACRIGSGADLPPGPPEPCAPTDIAGVVGAVEIAALPRLPVVGLASPRGPPSA